MKSSFHLSLGVRSIDESLDFFVRVLGGQVLHRDPSGYVNLDLFGCQLTLKQSSEVTVKLADFHFGVNLNLAEFERTAERILADSPRFVVMKPKVVDSDTALERRKMYLKCPTGYLIELKGYRD
jgi:extradiol dioxygenase family protein